MTGGTNVKGMAQMVEVPGAVPLRSNEKTPFFFH